MSYVKSCCANSGLSDDENDEENEENVDCGVSIVSDCVKPNSEDDISFSNSNDEDR